LIQTTLVDEDEEYRAFVDKFKPRKTTDDCHTPPQVYEAVADWVAKEYGVDRADMVRPFWPGGDYERFGYPPGCCVVDNPPFSIVTRIRRFYQAHGVRYFLFAPALTLISAFDARDDACFLACAAGVTYENGAVVRTSFVTNLDAEHVLRTAPDLVEAVEAANDEALAATRGAPPPRYVYPDAVLTAARAQWIAHHGVDYRVRRGEAVRVSTLDAMRGSGKGIYGAALLLSERAAAERAAAERTAAERAAAERAAAERAAAERDRAIVWELSERERAIQALLGRREDEE
jgi:hypothetical protein